MRIFPRLHAARRENARLRYLLGRRDLLITYQRERMKAMAQQRLDATTGRLVERVVVAKHGMERVR